MEDGESLFKSKRHISAFGLIEVFLSTFDMTKTCLCFAVVKIDFIGKILIFLIFFAQTLVVSNC